MKMPLTGLINDQIILSDIPEISANHNVNLSLAYQIKCDNMFSDPESDTIFSHLSVTPGLYIFSSHMW